MLQKQNKTKQSALLYLLLIAIIGIGVFTACKSRSQLPMANYSTEIDEITGIVDENGNTTTFLIYTNWVTNKEYVTNYQDRFFTNYIEKEGEKVFITNIITQTLPGKTVYITNVEVKYYTNTVVDTSKADYYKYHKSTMYKVYAPFTGIGAAGEYKYTNVSYFDTETLNALWKKMMRRAAFGSVGQGYYIKRSQEAHRWYFDENMDLRWTHNNELIRKFVQGVIVQLKDYNAGHYMIAGLYELADSKVNLAKLNSDGINMLAGSVAFNHDRPKGTLDILVMNTGKYQDNQYEYAVQLYSSSYNYTAGSNPYNEQRPDYYMQYIDKVQNLWENYNNTFQRNMWFRQQ